MTTIAPGAVSRAVARIHLSSLKVCALGGAALILVLTLIVGGVVLLPNYISATLAFMGMMLLVVGYMFGRVSLQLSFGKYIQKRFLPESSRSETLAVLLGVMVWTFLLSLPYVWLIGLFVIFAVGIGLIATGWAPAKWQNA